MITALSSNTMSHKTNNSKASTPAFGHAEEIAAAAGHLEFPRKLTKIFNDLKNVVDEKWVKYRKSKNFVPGTYPEFPAKRVSKGRTVSLSLNNNDKERYVLDVTNGFETERINISRENPQKFVYEKLYTTDKGGSYSSKTFNSERQKDVDMVKKVYAMYEEYLPIFSNTSEKALKLANKNESYFNKADLM